MLAARVIPCLDVRDGRVVKGVKFQNLRDSGDPAELAAEYCRQGADEIVILDISATDEARKTAAETVERVRSAINIPLTVGGGVTSDEDVVRLLRAGADKVSVNTAAVRSPNILTDMADQYGRQCTVLALDAVREGSTWKVVTRAGKQTEELDAIEWAARAESLGAGEILLTSWDRDGTRSGYDLALIGAVAEAVKIPIIASGGAAHAGHMAEALNAGASAVLAASIFHESEMTVGSVKEELRAAGIEVRL